MDKHFKGLIYFGKFDFYVSVCICLPYFAGTELDNQKARAEFINKNTKTEYN